MNQYIYKYTYLDSSFSEINWWFGDLVAQLYPILATQWTTAYQAPLSMGLPRQEYPNWPCAHLPSLWSALGLEAAPTLRSVSPGPLTLRTPRPLLSQSSPAPPQRSSSVQPLSRVWRFAIPWTAAHQAFLSITNSRAYSNSHPSSWWCRPTISSSVVPFSHLQSFPASGSFPIRVEQISAEISAQRSSKFQTIPLCPFPPTHEGLNKHLIGSQMVNQWKTKKRRGRRKKITPGQPWLSFLAGYEIFLSCTYYNIRMVSTRLPRCLSDKESIWPTQETWFNPWSWKMPPVTEQLSPGTTTTELVF